MNCVRFAKDPDRIHIWNEEMEYLFQKDPSGEAFMSYKENGKGHHWNTREIKTETFDNIKQYAEQMISERKWHRIIDDNNINIGG